VRIRAGLSLIAHNRYCQFRVNERFYFTSFITVRHSNIYIYILCLSVCLYPTNVKTAKSIGPKFEKFASNKIPFSLNVENHKIYLIKSAIFGLYLFYNVYKEKMFTIEIEDVRFALKALFFIIYISPF